MNGSPWACIERIKLEVARGLPAQSVAALCDSLIGDMRRDASDDGQFTRFIDDVYYELIKEARRIARTAPHDAELLRIIAELISDRA